MSPEDRHDFESWMNELGRRVEKRLEVTASRTLPKSNSWKSIVFGVGATLIAGVIGYGASALLDHGTRITAVETTQTHIRSDISEIKVDVKSLIRESGRSQP